MIILMAMMKMTMKKAVCPLVAAVLALACLPLVVESFVLVSVVGRREACRLLFMSSTSVSTSEEWKARSLNQPVPAPYYPQPNVQVEGALQRATTPAQQLAQQQLAQQQQAAAATAAAAAALATMAIPSARSIPKERFILGLPTDEWWNRPLDRERDPVPPHQEWKKFYQDGTLPKRIRGGTFMYDNYYSCL
jgi:hypothetical protein